MNTKASRTLISILILSTGMYITFLKKVEKCVHSGKILARYKLHSLLYIYNVLVEFEKNDCALPDDHSIIKFFITFTH